MLRALSPAYLCTWWNPAQLSILDKSSFTFGSGLYSLGRTEAFSSLEFKATPRVGIGLFALYRGDPFIDNLYNDQYELLEKAHSRRSPSNSASVTLSPEK